MRRRQPAYSAGKPVLLFQRVQDGPGGDADVKDMIGQKQAANAEDDRNRDRHPEESWSIQFEVIAVAAQQEGAGENVRRSEQDLIQQEMTGVAG